MKYLQPQCKECGRHGLLDKGFCAIHYYHKFGKWSEKFTAGKEKHMKIGRTKK